MSVMFHCTLLLELLASFWQYRDCLLVAIDYLFICLYMMLSLDAVSAIALCSVL